LSFLSKTAAAAAATAFLCSATDAHALAAADGPVLAVSAHQLLFAAAPVHTELAHTKQAHDEPSRLRQRYLRTYSHVADATGANPGRNIVKWGMAGGDDASAADIRRSLDVMHRMLGRPEKSSSIASSPSGGIPADLAAVAQCESGGNPAAVSAGGTYRGLFQFDQGTWESVGGSGDPAAASVSEQVLRAQILRSQRGSSPWPVCG
jgi:hypothetical protein